MRILVIGAKGQLGREFEQASTSYSLTEFVFWSREDFDITDPKDFDQVKGKLADAKIKMESSDITFLPKTTVEIKGDTATQCLEMMDEFEDHDDVKSAYANFDIPKEFMKEA